MYVGKASAMRSGSVDTGCIVRAFMVCRNRPATQALQNLRIDREPDEVDPVARWRGTVPACQQPARISGVVVARTHWPEICFLVGHEDTTWPAHIPGDAPPGSGGASHRGVVRVAAASGNCASHSRLVDLRCSGVGGTHSVCGPHRGIDRQPSRSPRVERDHSRRLTFNRRTCCARSSPGPHAVRKARVDDRPDRPVWPSAAYLKDASSMKKLLVPEAVST